MARLYYNFQDGNIDAELAEAGTTLSSPDLANLPAISGDFVALVLDPSGANGAPEIVYVTAHTGAATTATITRAQEGTSARIHPNTTAWALAAVAQDMIPAGLICMWHGTLANIPAGWVLCDGTNGTPDLRDKFVRGAANAANPGTTGGADTHTHADGTYAAASTVVAEHPNITGDVGSSGGARVFQNGGTDHEAHTHDITGTSGSGSTLPAYYAVAFIMKV